MVRMFSGSEDYVETKDGELIRQLQSELRYANSVSEDVRIVQKVSDKTVIAVYDWRVRLDDIVKKFPCGEFMHTHRSIQRGIKYDNN